MPKDFELDDQDFLESEEPEAGQDADAPEAGEGKGGSKPDPAISAMQKRLDELEAKNRELSESERYWAEVAKRGGRRGAEDDEPEPEPEPEPEEDAEAFAEDLAASGIKALYKRGIPTKKEVQQFIAEAVNRQVSNLRREADLMTAHPDLRNEGSPLFRKTAEILKTHPALKGNPTLQKSGEGLRIAADLAAAQLAAEGRRGRSDDDDVDRRIAAQGDRPGRRRMADDDDGAADLGPEERQLIGMMSKFGVTEKGFRRFRDEGRRR